jgi:hypothetical protein
MKEEKEENTIAQVLPEKDPIFEDNESMSVHVFIRKDLGMGKGKICA